MHSSNENIYKCCRYTKMHYNIITILDRHVKQLQRQDETKFVGLET